MLHQLIKHYLFKRLHYKYCVLTVLTSIPLNQLHNIHACVNSVDIEKQQCKYMYICLY